MAKKILVSRNFSDKWLSYLRKQYEVKLWEQDSPAGRDWLLSNLDGMEGAIVMLTDVVDREFISCGDRLKVISTMSVGYEHIDVDYAREKGITVCNTPDVLTDSTADTAFSLLLATARRIVEGDRLIRNGNWTEKWNPRFMLGREVSGKTMGIYGLGRIGEAVARRALAFGMSVIYNSRNRKEHANYEYVGFEELLSRSDFLVVTVSLNDKTRHSINERALSAMKPESIIVNVSRGPVVDEKSLYMALKEGKIAGAGLDVFEHEPIEPGNPLITLENVVLSPHLGSSTFETRDKMAELAATNLQEVLEGRVPKYVVR